MSRMYPLIDRLIDGQLAERLAVWRADGWSFQQIADHFRDNYGVSVSDETVRNWFDDDGQVNQ